MKLDKQTGQDRKKTSPDKWGKKIFFSPLTNQWCKWKIKKKTKIHMTDKFANEKLFPCSNKSDLHTHTLSIISIKYQDKMKILFIIVIIIIQFKSLKFSSCVCVYVINNKWWCHKQRHQEKKTNSTFVYFFVYLIGVNRNK